MISISICKNNICWGKTDLFQSEKTSRGKQKKNVLPPDAGVVGRQVKKKVTRMSTTNIAYKLFQKNHQYEIHSRRRWKRKSGLQTLCRRGGGKNSKTLLTHKKQRPFHGYFGFLFSLWDFCFLVGAYSNFTIRSPPTSPSPGTRNHGPGRAGWGPLAYH